MRSILLITGFTVLFLVEILNVYLIMPFPGSQEYDSIAIAYFIHDYVAYLRLLGLGIVIIPLLHMVRNGGRTVRIVLSLVLILYAVIFYLFNYRYTADHMFLQVKNKRFLDASHSRVSVGNLVLGITLHNKSKAYPIEIIGYHHQVRDTLGGEPIMVTYCTVCRTGRVYSPILGNKADVFRLVGMDHYNAMFEDASTGSWWRQVNGEAIAGPLRGSMLREIGSEQMTLGAWINLHPETLILQPDSIFQDKYEKLAGYDKGRRKGRLERKDSTSWNDKSWVVGIQVGMDARAYDWNDLQRMNVINDVIGGVPVVLIANADSASFHSYSRVVNGDTLAFALNGNRSSLVDDKTGSFWNWSGRCEEGLLKEKSLPLIQSYQEYWHSWRTFHPQTSRYLP